MKWANRLIWACCALYVGVVVTPTGLYEGAWKLVTDKDAAAWVQAFGSIGAIIGAAWIAAHQSREALIREERAWAVALERDREALRARRSSLIGLCDMLTTAASIASESLRIEGSEPFRRLPGSPLNVLSSFDISLQSFPFEVLESSEGAAILFKIRSMLPEIIESMAELFDCAKICDEEGFKSRREIFVYSASSLEGEYRNLRAALGFPLYDDI